MFQVVGCTNIRNLTDWYYSTAFWLIRTSGGTWFWFMPFFLSYCVKLSNGNVSPDVGGCYCQLSSTGSHQICCFILKFGPVYVWICCPFSFRTLGIICQITFVYVTFNMERSSIILSHPERHIRGKRTPCEYGLLWISNLLNLLWLHLPQVLYLHTETTFLFMSCRASKIKLLLTS